MSLFGMAKTAIYCRVSTIDQQNLNQSYVLSEYCKNNNWEYEIFEEVESTRHTRPIKQIVLDKLRKKEFERVVVYKLDRWARSSQELLSEIMELTNKGIIFVSYKENFDLGTPVGRLHFGILSVFAEFERDLIKERSREGMNRARRQGKHMGRPKGKKDSKIRKKGGYYLRYAGKKRGLSVQTT